MNHMFAGYIADISYRSHLNEDSFVGVRPQGQTSFKNHVGAWLEALKMVALLLVYLRRKFSPDLSFFVRRQKNHDALDLCHCLADDVTNDWIRSTFCGLDCVIPFHRSDAYR